SCTLLPPETTTHLLPSSQVIIHSCFWRLSAAGAHTWRQHVEGPKIQATKYSSITTVKVGPWIYCIMLQLKLSITCKTICSSPCIWLYMCKICTVVAL